MTTRVRGVQRQTRPAPPGLVLLLLLSGCSDLPAALPEPQRATLARASCPAPFSEDRFFETGTLGRNLEEHRRFAAAYGTFLEEAALSPFSCGDVNDAYRVIWSHPSRPLLIVEAVRTDLSWTVQSVRFGDPKDQAHLVVAERTTRLLDTAQVQKLRAAARETGVWRKEHIQTRMVEDSPAMFIEARRGESYHFILRVPPTDNALVSFARALISVSDATYDDLSVEAFPRP